jgi:tetratricopeptide (TPR) repeat protein
VKTVYKIFLFLSLTGFAAGCANPLHQATSVRYAEQCSDAEDAGRWGAAEQACYRALMNAVWGHLGEDKKSMRMYNLARIKRQLKKYDEAEKLFKESLAIEEKQQVPSDEKIGRRLAELAILYEQWGRIHDGFPYVQRLYPLADAYEGGERKVVAAIFYVYSVKLEGKESQEEIQKFKAKSIEMGFNPKDLAR